MSDKGVKMHVVDILCQYMSRFNCKVKTVWQYICTVLTSYVNICHGLIVRLQQFGNTTPKAQEANSFPTYESVPKAHTNKGKDIFVPV